MARSITHGIQNLALYPISGGQYGAPIFQNGARAFSRNTTQELISFFADNRVHVQQYGLLTIDGEITLSQIDKETYKAFLGFDEETNGMMTDGAAKRPAGIAFATLVTNSEGQTVYRIVSLFDNSLSNASESWSTDEEAITNNEFVIPYVGKTSDFVKGKGGKYIAYSFVDMFVGASEEDVIDFLSLGMPTPDSEMPVNPDSIPPVITVTTPTVTYTTAENGTVQYGDLVTECGITAIDDVDGDVINNVKYVVNAIEYTAIDLIALSTPGTIEVTLNVQDAALNSATPEIITITVT